MDTTLSVVMDVLNQSSGQVTTKHVQILPARKTDYLLNDENEWDIELQHFCNSTASGMSDQVSNGKHASKARVALMCRFAVCKPRKLASLDKLNIRQVYRTHFRNDSATPSRGTPSRICEFGFAMNAICDLKVTSLDNV